MFLNQMKSEHLKFWHDAGPQRLNKFIESAMVHRFNIFRGLERLIC